MQIDHIMDSWVEGKRKAGRGLLDLDFMTGLDWLDMSWVYLVLARKCVRQEVIERLAGHVLGLPGVSQEMCQTGGY